MSKRKNTLVDRLREWLEMAGKLLSPNAPVPQPIPIPTNEKKGKNLKR